VARQLYSKTLAPIFTDQISGEKYNNVAKAEVLLLALCDDEQCNGTDCCSIDDLESHGAVIENIVRQLKKLEDLVLKIYYCQLDVPSDTLVSEHTRPTEILERLIALPATIRIEIYPFVGIPGQEDRDSAHHAVVAYETDNKSSEVWTRKEAWQKSNASDAQR
jgi:hypothetical protein